MNSKRDGTLRRAWQQSLPMKRMTRRFGLFVLLCMMALNAGAAAAQILVTLSLKEVSLETAINKAEQQMGMTFFFNRELVNLSEKVDVDLQNADLDRLVEELFGKDFKYRLVDNLVVVTKKNEPAPSVQQQPQFIDVLGVVRDANGNPLPGVSVLVKEAITVGTATDIEGRFLLKVPAKYKNSPLIVSFIGMKTKEVKLTGSPLQVTLEEDLAAISEVVVNGYFQQSKNSFTGAARTITSEELQQGSNQNLLTALQNIDPSFVKIENNAMGSNPNAVPDFQIRGSGSINTSSMRDSYQGNPNMPVFIVNGFETSAEKVFDMDPYRVESITLLKDAAATAIYGSRASNGVVVITTNSPAKGKLSASYNGDMSFYIPDLSAYDLCSPQEKLQLEVLAGLYDASKKLYFTQDQTSDQIYMDLAYNRRLAAITSGVNTDWLSKPLDEVAIGHKHSIRLDGGNDNIRYAMDLNYNDTPGVMKKSGRKRVGLGMELQYTYKNITFRDQLTYSKVTAINSPYGEFSEYAKLNPYAKAYNEDGSYIYQVDIDDRWIPSQYADPMFNPLYNTTLNSIDESAYDDLTNLFGLDWRITEGLRLKGNFSFTLQNTSADIFKSGKHTDFAVLKGEDFDRRGSYMASRGDVFDYDASLVLSYFWQKDKHVINSNLGWNIQESKTKTFSVTAEGFPNDNLDYISFATQYEKAGSPSGDEYTSRLIGLLGNVNYSYDERYMLDFSFRGDASSRFGADKRWAPFYSVGLGWNLHNEKFMKNATWLDELKLRTTYGMTGSQEYDPYQAITTYQYLTGERYHFGVGAEVMGMGNDKLSWQRTTQTNIGLDLSLLKGRVELSADYYVKTSKDVLTAVTLPPSLGFTSYMDNLGEVENKGYELSARVNILNNKENGFYWSVYGTMLHNENKLLKISNALKAYNEEMDEETEKVDASGQRGDGVSRPKVRFVEGASINSIWVNKSLGVDPLTGREMFVAKNGDIVSDWSASNYVIGGCTDPDLEGTFGSNFSWKGFQLNLIFRYRLGGQTYNQTLVDKVQDIDPRYNADRRAFTERWQKPGDEVRFTGFVQTYDGMNVGQKTLPTSRFVEDYNYLELSTLNIAYDFNVKKLEKYGVKRLKALFYMNDVFHTSTVKQERGTAYPYARNFSVGLQVRF